MEGVRWVVTNRESFDSVRLGLEVAAALQKLYPGKISFEANRKLIGSEAVIRRLTAGEDPRTIQQKLDRVLSQDFSERYAEKYLLISDVGLQMYAQFRTSSNSASKSEIRLFG